MTILCFEAHHADGRVWALRHRGRWTRTRRVVVKAPTVTVYRGKLARQPKAYLAFPEPVVVNRGRGALIVRAS
jgi:hypothetical protein